MKNRPNLDMDVLRTFAAGFELGSFARAADRLGRSQSAVSTQLRKLEEQIGQPLVRKAGRGLVPTPAGERLLAYARRILDLNDEAVGAVRDLAFEGRVRLGLPQDFAETWLPGALGRFARTHPRVRVDVRTDHNATLIGHTIKGELDLSLAWGDGGGAPHAERLADLAILWIGRPDWPGVKTLGSTPLPLIAFDPPCVFRTAGVSALDAAGIGWRVSFSSPSLAGSWAAVEAGLGVTLRTRVGLPKKLVPLGPSSGLPRLPVMPLALHRAERDPDPATGQLAAIVRESILEEVGRLKGPRRV
ncbi:MAG: LysR family transcriptional regulator [Proteobacteria bacterium]|nr:LysR family transcriptional regulator [Pseudomonadota bacterium]